MQTLCFTDDNGAVCQVTLGDPKLPAAISSQLEKSVDAWFDIHGMDLDRANSDIQQLGHQPLFFEWQRLEWLYEPAPLDNLTPPLLLTVNGTPEKNIHCRKLGGRYRLSGSFTLGNAVGKTRFEIVDSRGIKLFSLGAEVFPQKLDYKEDFPAMISEVTEIVYSLAFDLFKKTYTSTKAVATYHQSLSEWLNLYRVLADTFEKSIDTILRSPKSELKREARIKPVDRVKQVNHKAISRAIQKPQRFCRGGGYQVRPGLHISHLEEQHKQVSYNTQENRFVAWAINDVIKKLKQICEELGKRKGIPPERLKKETSQLQDFQQHLRFRLADPVFVEAGTFNHQQQFSTTLTMAPGYKEFYHRYLLLRKGLALADDDIFKMDYKDIATLYEYWCFLKTVKLLRDNPRYDLTSTDIVKIEHQKFAVNLKKGQCSAVHFKQRTTGDDISLYYNRSFSRKKYTSTFDQAPDNFIEFSRAGYKNPKDKKTFKVVLDAKYRFDKGSADYPNAPTPYGPPIDTIAQLHRYRDAILWQQDTDDSVKVANKSLGGVILFPYPNNEHEFVHHPFYESIDKVNIGAIPLQPGSHRKNELYTQYLDSLFEQSGEAINEQRIHYDNRPYRGKQKAQQSLVMVGMIPKNHREERLRYHLGKHIFYTQWAKDSKYPMDKVSAIALYDQKTSHIIGIGEVKSVDFLLGGELASTGTTWPARKTDAKHCVFYLGEIQRIDLSAGQQMQGNRNGRYFVSRLGLDLAVEHKIPDLQYIHSWEQYQEWKLFKTKHASVKVKRKPKYDADGHDISELTFTEDSNRSS